MQNAFESYEIALTNIPKGESTNYAKRIFNKIMFGTDMISLGFGEQVKVSSSWVQYQRDQKLGSGEPVEDVYLYNGKKLENKYTTIQYNKYSPNAPLFNKSYEVTLNGKSKTLYYGDAQTWEEKQAFYRYAGQPNTNMNGQAVDLSIVLTYDQLISEFGTERNIPLIDKKGNVFKYSIDQVIADPYLAKQIGIDSKPTKTSYNTEAWDKIGMDKIIEKNQKGVYVISGLKYNLHNFTSTGGTEKAKSGEIKN